MQKTKCPISKSKLKSLDTILCLLFLGSMGLVVWGINIYRLTIIHPAYLAVITVLGTVIAFLLIRQKAKFLMKMIWILFISLGIGGGISFYSFLFLNSNFSVKEIFTEDFNIIKTGTLAKGKHGKCGEPYAIIDFKGIRKQLVFYCDDKEAISKSSKVRLEYESGLFGFKVIRTKILLN